MLYVQVLEKNARWDKYSAEREKHVMSLQRETTALADQLAKLRLAHSADVSEIQQDKVSRSEYAAVVAVVAAAAMGGLFFA